MSIQFQLDVIPSGRIDSNWFLFALQDNQWPSILHSVRIFGQCLSAGSALILASKEPQQTPLILLSVTLSYPPSQPRRFTFMHAIILQG